LRAAKIAKSLFKLYSKGVGNEYQRIEEIKKKGG
jgi:hypothetical protein